MSYRTISKDELEKIIKDHGEWLADNSKGARAVLVKDLGYKYWATSSGIIASAFHPCGSPRQLPLILKQRTSKTGYKQITYRGKNRLSHRVIASAFLGDVHGRIVHHRDGDRAHNAVCNLLITDTKTNNKIGAKTMVERRKMYGQFIEQCAELFKSGGAAAKGEGEGE